MHESKRNGAANGSNPPTTTIVAGKSTPEISTAFGPNTFTTGWSRSDPSGKKRVPHPFRPLYGHQRHTLRSRLRFRPLLSFEKRLNRQHSYHFQIMKLVLALSDRHVARYVPKVEIKVSKYQNRVLVYGIEGGFPMFFDIDGRGKDIFPTVYALWKVPDLLPSFMLKGGEVSRYVIGGADLMFPGISIPAEGLPSFIAGEAWAVKVPGNPASIAVGTTTMSCTEALKAGLRGKALKIAHYYGDLLWESVEGPYVPNAGFLEDAVFEDPTLSSAQISDSYNGANDGSHDQLNGIDDKEMGQHVDVADVQSEPSSASVALIDARNEIAEEITANVDDLKLTDDDSANQSTGEDQHPLSAEDVDMLLEKCLLQALHTTVKDKDLPMPGSTLWSNYVLPCRPSGITLDIKKSSHKKLSKWLQAQCSTGLVYGLEPS